ncbi:hypothetical protein B9Z19DRAFT_1086007 [Tuber borchii]|uniref:Uncharacterized protein n=1 Tax=Tuber borchii TaxID=42251 RepID=A0A2T6ZQ41_TUBBO|nr:hypothetical protein B9Z19DRAFT_1086007 [Tuber borchii]
MDCVLLLVLPFYTCRPSATLFLLLWRIFSPPSYWYPIHPIPVFYILPYLFTYLCIHFGLLTILMASIHGPPFGDMLLLWPSLAQPELSLPTPACQPRACADKSSLAYSSVEAAGAQKRYHSPACATRRSL